MSLSTSVKVRQREKKEAKVAEIWSPKLASTGYFEIVNGFLEHYACCLGLGQPEAMLVLHLMKHRSLTLSHRRRAREQNQPLRHYVESGFAWPGKASLAAAMGILPRQVAEIAARLENRLGITIRSGQKDSYGPNLWDLQPLLDYLDEHIQNHGNDKPCPCKGPRKKLSTAIPQI